MRRIKYLIVIFSVICAVSLVSSVSLSQKGPKVATVRGDLSASTHIMLQDLKEDVVDYPANADLFGKIKDYWLIWVGWSNSNGVVRQAFAKNGKDFQEYLRVGGAFVMDTASSDMHEIYELLPGKVRTNNIHSSIETSHVVDKKLSIVNKPNDIADDAFYANWAWSAGDTYTSWDDYIVVTTKEDKNNSPPTWVMHKSLPIVVTTLQPTWSGHMRPKMVQNIHFYVKNFKLAVDPKDKLPLTWAKVKEGY